MKIELIVIGKTNFSFIEEGIMEYKSRINHFINFEIIVLPDVKQKLPIALVEPMDFHKWFIRPFLIKFHFLDLLFLIN